MPSTASTLDNKKPIDVFIVGVNITQHAARYRKQKGMIENVAKAVYVRANLSKAEKTAVIARNACRIANVLHPKALLAGSSAFHLSEVKGIVTLLYDMPIAVKELGDGVSMYCLRSTNLAGKSKMVTIEDDFGTCRIRAVTDGFNILSNFSGRWGRNAPPQCFLTTDDLIKLIHRALATAGSKEQLIAIIKDDADAISKSQLPFKRAKEFIERTFS